MKKINFIKFIKDVMKASQIDGKLHLYTPDDYKVLGYYNNRPIALLKEPDDIRVHGFGSVMCIAVKNIGGYLILRDSYLDGIPDYVKQFSINHEIGHILNGDLDHYDTVKTVTYNGVRVVKDLSFEYKADIYAASVIGADYAISALTYIRRSLPFGLASKKQLNQRIKNIKRYSGSL